MATFDRNNPYQTTLFERKVVKPYFKEYRNNTQFSSFMGGVTSVIHSVVQNKGEGDTIVFPVRQTFMPVVKRGVEQLVGDESELTYTTDEVRIGTVRFATRVTNQQLLDLQVNSTLDADIKDDLLYQASMVNTKRVVSAFGLSFSPSTIYDKGQINYNFAYSEIVTKMLACGIDIKNADGDAISSQRVMFGADYRTNETSVNAVVSAANFSVANGHTMSVKHISKLVTLARTGGRVTTPYKESGIRPYKVVNPRNGYSDNRYVLFLAPETYNHMRDNDPDWRNQLSRGVIENANQQPSIMYGSQYKGSVEGVDVIVVDELANFTTTAGNANSLVAYSVLCGASALGFGMGGPVRFEDDLRDYKMHKGVAHIEISGMKALKYPSKGDLTQPGTNSLLVDNGMVHSFVKIS